MQTVTETEDIHISVSYLSYENRDNVFEMVVLTLLFKLRILSKTPIVEQFYLGSYTAQINLLCKFALKLRYIGIDLPLLATRK